MLSIEELQKELSLSVNEIAEMFDMSEASFRASSAKGRYTKALCSLYARVRDVDGWNIDNIQVGDKVKTKGEVYAEFGDLGRKGLRKFEGTVKLIVEGSAIVNLSYSAGHNYKVLTNDLERIEEFTNNQ